MSSLKTKLAKLHVKRGTRPSTRELRALGLRPVPPGQVARLNQRGKRGEATAAGAPGQYYWYDYNLSGSNVWVSVWYNVYYETGVDSPYYLLYNEYWVCDPNGNNCIDTNVATYEYEAEYTGVWYYYGPNGFTPSANTNPGLGWGPYTD